MLRSCHRCHADLPAGDGYEGRALFCPECGAPQLVLAESLRLESASAGDGRTTTGTTPPPRPQMVDWGAALSSALPVALASGVLAVLSWVVPAASLLNTLCILGGAGIAMMLYRARRPAARIDGRVGLRIGLLTGVLIVTASGVAMAAAGGLERFGVHGLSGFDAGVTQQFTLLQGQMAESMNAQSQPPAVRDRVLAWTGAPEFRAGYLLLCLGFLAVLTLVFSGAGGAFAGMLQTRRRGLPRLD